RTPGGLYAAAGVHIGVGGFNGMDQGAGGTVDADGVGQRPPLAERQQEGNPSQRDLAPSLQSPTNPSGKSTQYVIGRRKAGQHFLALLHEQREQPGPSPGGTQLRLPGRTRAGF